MSRLAAALCFVCLCMAGWSLYVEAGPYLAGAPADRERLDRAGSFPPGYSLSSTKFSLDECAWAMTSLYGTLQAGPVRKAIARSCNEQTQSVLATRPSYAYAWLIRAVAADVLGDLELFNASLIAAQRLAPTSEWQARSRARLSGLHEADLTAEAVAAEDADLAILVHSQEGIASIAQRYVDQPDFRERITTIVETLPDTDQRRFLANVQVAVAQLKAGRT